MRTESEGLIGTVLRWRSTPITIHVAPDRFVFSAATSTVSVGTFLHLQNATGELRVLAVGEEVTSHPDVRRLELFSDHDHPPEGIDRMACLAAFCRFAIWKVSGRKRLIRPPVKVVGAQSLAPFLHGFERAVLFHALAEAGASSVEFE